MKGAPSFPRKECGNALALAVLLALSPTALGTQKAAADPAKMQWWQVCLEHGRHLRARTHDKPRAIAIGSAAAKYGFTAADIAVALNREPRLGMDVCAAMAAYGCPNANNRSVGPWGTDEQWVYRQRDLYLYFRNGKLRSYQIQ